MKNWIAIALLFAATSAFSQSTLPLEVKTAFKSQFPKAEAVKWKKYKDRYEAHFRFKQQAVSAAYQLDGKWLQTTTQVSAEGLPEVVLKKVFEAHQDGSISSAQKVETSLETNYEIQVENEDVELYLLIIRKDGTILKHKSLDYDMDENDDEEG